MENRLRERCERQRDSEAARERERDLPWGWEFQRGMIQRLSQSLIIPHISLVWHRMCLPTFVEWFHPTGMFAPGQRFHSLDQKCFGLVWFSSDNDGITYINVLKLNYQFILPDLVCLIPWNKGFPMLLKKVNLQEKERGRREGKRKRNSQPDWRSLLHSNKQTYCTHPPPTHHTEKQRENY